MNYCSKCGNEQLSFEIPEGDNFKRYICRNCNTIHYQNPRMIVSCLPIYENKIVICRRAIEPCKGTWNLPGGFMENGETAEEGALRELKEETGLTGKIQSLHCTFSIPHVDQVYLIFLTEITELDFNPGEESLEVAAFEEADIPWKEIGFNSSIYAIEKYLEDKNSTNLKTHIGNYRHLGLDNRGAYRS